MDPYTQFMAAITAFLALLAALAHMYIMVWKTTQTSKKAAEQATAANDAVNNIHPESPRLGDNVMELVHGYRAQTKMLERHSEAIKKNGEDIKRNGKDLKTMQSCWSQTVERLDGIAETCCALRKEGPDG